MQGMQGMNPLLAMGMMNPMMAAAAGTAPLLPAPVALLVDGRPLWDWLLMSARSVCNST